MQGLVGKGQFHALRGHNLHTIAVENVFAYAAHIVFKRGFARKMLRRGALAAQRQRNGNGLAQFFAQVFQLFARFFVALRLAGVGIHNQINFAA